MKPALFAILAIVAIFSAASYAVASFPVEHRGDMGDGWHGSRSSIHNGGRSGGSTHGR